MIYGIGAQGGEAGDEMNYVGPAGRLTGGAAFSAGILVNSIALSGEDAMFSNFTGPAGWFVALSQSPADPRVILATLQFSTDAPSTDVITVPIGSGSNEWLFIAFSVSDGEGVSLTVYVNGEVVYVAGLLGAVIPSLAPAQPSISVESDSGATLVSWAFYTDAALSAADAADINAQLKRNAGAIDNAVVALQHIYSASQSMRPNILPVWADIGSTPTAPLTFDDDDGNVPHARVLPGDFAQAVIGAIVDPSGPVVP
jgi:hypothetical protein